MSLSLPEEPVRCLTGSCAGHYDTQSQDKEPARGPTGSCVVVYLTSRARTRAWGSHRKPTHAKPEVYGFSEANCGRVETANTDPVWERDGLSRSGSGQCKLH